MSIEVEATYSNGTLRLDHPLQLGEQERVTIEVKPKATRIRQAIEAFGWSGDLAVLRKVAEDDEFDDGG